MNAQYSTGAMQISSGTVTSVFNGRHGATQINGCTIGPIPNGTITQHVFNYERRKKACKYFDMDVALCNVPLGTKYILCVDNDIFTVEPNGIIAQHLKTIKYIVYPNGDAAHMSMHNGSITIVKYDESNSMPIDMFNTLLDESIMILVFSSTTPRDLITSYNLDYAQKSIDELILRISQEIDHINKWFIACTKLITDEKLKNKHIIKLYITDQAKSQLKLNDRVINDIIGHAMIEIEKIIN
jgi:hypothetical protein